MQPRQLIEPLLVGLHGFLHRVTVQDNTGRSARANPSYERIDQYLDRDLIMVEKRDLSPAISERFVACFAETLV
jgi:hypothetical protein